MARWAGGWWWTVALLLLPSVLWAQPPQLPMERRYNEFSQAIDASSGNPDKERARVLEKKYQELFPVTDADSLARAANDDLELLYRSTVNASRLVGRPDYVQRVERILGALHSRRLASKRHYSYLYGLYIQMRMLDEAKRLSDQDPSWGMDPVPEFRVADTLPAGWPTELVVSQERHELVRRSVDVTAPAQIVVIAHPSCHFSSDAMLAIEQDPVLADVFRNHAKWLAPVDFSFDFDVIRDWNTQHPRTEIALAFNPNEWPMLDSWATPTFYFLKHGKLLAKVVGWPKEGRRDELRMAARQVGLLDEDQ